MAIKKKVYKKRVARKRTTKSVAKLGKAVRSLQRKVQAEKKLIDISTGPILLGQVDLNASAHYTQDITPAIGTGTGQGARNGASVKLVSYYHKFLFYSQSGKYQPMRIKIEYWRVKGLPFTSISSFVTTMYDGNPFTGFFDYNAPLDPDYFGTSKLLLSRDVYIPAPQYSSGVGSQIKEFVIKGKMNNALRWDGGTNTLTDGQIIMLIRCDSGNINASSSSTANIPVSVGNTGVSMFMQARYYYIDN